MPSPAAARAGEALWQEVEYGGYTADLELWRRLAAEASGPAQVLELGSGIGRVALALAADGHRVTALDSDPALVAELERRARERGLEVVAVPADARSFALDARFDLVLAPMQLAAMLRAGERAEMLACAARHLAGGGLVALALLDPAFEPIDLDPPPLADVREIDGWIYSSQPLSVRPDEEPPGLLLDRLRQVVSPEGRLEEALHSVRVEVLSRDEVADQARAAGLHALKAVWVPETRDHVASLVMLFRADG